MYNQYKFIFFIFNLFESDWLICDGTGVQLLIINVQEVTDICYVMQYALQFIIHLNIPLL